MLPNCEVNEHNTNPKVQCRICHSRSIKKLIVSPCKCKGSMAYVHFQCLEQWLNFSSRDRCELCLSRFQVRLSRRYTLLQSLRVWIRHPANRAFIMCDLVIGVILTLLTFGLITICFIGLTQFTETDKELGVSSIWSESLIDVILIILVGGYLGTVFSMGRDHVRHWYAWWINCNNIQLVLDKNTSFFALQTERHSPIISSPPRSELNSINENLLTLKPGAGFIEENRQKLSGNEDIQKHEAEESNNANFNIADKETFSQTNSIPISKLPLVHPPTIV